MKPIVKTLALLTIFFLSATIAMAQILKPAPANSIAAYVQRVIDDYPNHFNNIIGEVIIQNPQSTDYQCNFKVNGAEECTITKYSSEKYQVLSWQALMLTTEDFNKAKQLFRSSYNELNTVTTASMQLKGTYEAPSEDKKFTAILFSLRPVTESFKKLKVELVMESQGMDWKIKVLVYDLDQEKGEVE